MACMRALEQRNSLVSSLWCAPALALLWFLRSPAVGPFSRFPLLRRPLATRDSQLAPPFPFLFPFPLPSPSLSRSHPPLPLPLPFHISPSLVSSHPLQTTTTTTTHQHHQHPHPQTRARDSLPSFLPFALPSLFLPSWAPTGTFLTRLPQRAGTIGTSK